MATTPQNDSDPNAPLTESLVHWMTRQDPALAERETATREAAQSLAAQLVARNGFDGASPIDSARMSATGVPVFGQGERASTLLGEDWGKISAQLQFNSDRTDANLRFDADLGTGNRELQGNGTTRLGENTTLAGDLRFANSGTDTAGLNLDGRNTDATLRYNFEHESGNREVLGNGTTRLDENSTLAGDFRLGNFGTNTVGLNYDGLNTDGTLRYNADTTNGNREFLANGNTLLNPETTLNGDLRFGNFGTDTAGLNLDGRNTDATLRYNFEHESGNREVLGNGTTRLDENSTLAGDFRLGNFGTNTVGLNYDGLNTDGTLRYNADTTNGNREFLANGNTLLNPETTLNGDLRFGNFGTDTAGLNIDGKNTDASLRYNFEHESGNREVLGNGTTRLDENSTLAGDFRLGNFGTNTVGLNYDGLNTDGTLRYNADTTNGNREFLANGNTLLNPETTLNGDLRFGNFGTDTAGLNLDGRNTDATLRYNFEHESGNREVLGNGTTRLDENSTLAGDFRLGNFGTNTVGLNYDGLNTDGTLRYNADTTNGNREFLANGNTLLNPETTLNGDLRFGNFGTDTAGLNLDGRNTDASLRYNFEHESGNREVLGNGTTRLDENSTLGGDFRLGNFGTNTVGLNYDGLNTDGTLRYNADTTNGNREFLASGNTLLNPETTLNGDLRFGNFGTDTAGFNLDGRNTDATLRYNFEHETGNREVLGNGTTRLDENSTLGGDFRLGNFGTNTFGLNYDGLNTDGTLRYNADTTNGNREFLGNGTTRLGENSTLGGDFRLGNFGTNTLGLNYDGLNTDGSLRFNVDTTNGNREILGNGTTRLGENSTLGGDFRLGNFGTNTLGLNYDGLNTDGSLRFNVDTTNGNREILGNGTTRLGESSTLGGDFRLGNFGTNTLGLNLDGSRTDAALRFNQDTTNGNREFIGSASTQLSDYERLAGDFRLGNFGANTFGINYNKGNDLNGFDLGAMVRGSDGKTPGQFDIRGEYRFASEDERLNYAINGRLGTESQIGGRVSYRPNEDFRLDAAGAYNFTTGVGTGTLEALYKPKDRDLSFFANASVDTQGESRASIGLRWNFRENSAGSDFSQPMPRIPDQASIDSAAVDYRISQLRGNDRQLYDQAFDQVIRLNRDGADLPVRDSALGLAAMAERQGVSIADARLATGSDGRQTVWVGNGPLDNPATQTFSIDRTTLVNTQPLQALSDLRSTNVPTAPAPQQNDQPLRDFNNLEQVQEQQRTAGMGGR